jgi:hypothetical protein
MKNVVYLLNAFSLSMVSAMTQALGVLSVRVEALDLNEARELAEGVKSAVGHAGTATIFADQLQRPVAVERITVTLTEGESAIIGQYIGPRLEEGAVNLPSGVKIEWYLITVDKCR